MEDDVIKNEGAHSIHQDALAVLNKTIPLNDKLKAIHAFLKKRYGFVERIAVILYDAQTDHLKTYIHSSGLANPLTRYQIKLAHVPSLAEIAQTKTPRIIADLSILANEKKHTRSIVKEGYAASYTLPLFFNEALLGFVFFNSRQKASFNSTNQDDFNLFGHLISQLIINELAPVRTLAAMVHAANNITHYRDIETGKHLDRMAHYARLIAQSLATEFDFDDEYIEYIYLFAPLHDLGKIAIPDSVLLKAGRLDESELTIMRDHPLKGRQIIDSLAYDFGLTHFPHLAMLRNIAEFHHEAINGSGYPHGLTGDAIPIEARIVAVADTFDALTSKRRYKQAWTNDTAFSFLQEWAGVTLDKNCVNALITHKEQVIEIQNDFKEDAL